MPPRQPDLACTMRVSLALCLAAPAAAFQGAATPRSPGVLRSSPDIRTDVGSDWKPEQGGMEATDTPDFFYEDGDSRNTDIGFQDGIMGSTGLDKLQGMNQGGDPGVAGALDVDPTTIGGYQSASAADAGADFTLDTLAKMGRFTEEIKMDIPAGTTELQARTVSIKPVCMAYEDFYVGFAPESAPGMFSAEPTEGRMDRRGGAPTDVDIVVKADGQVGEKVGYMVMNLPEENEKFTVKITVNQF
mmetsp:Transcript_9915/g.32378  ORF Transcript_9915/g.32378 Transcript_9915/m.32378 type:complete len:245 (+) Transcript_9915:2-736(+)